MLSQIISDINAYQYHLYSSYSKSIVNEKTSKHHHSVTSPHPPIVLERRKYRFTILLTDKLRGEAYGSWAWPLRGPQARRRFVRSYSLRSEGPYPTRLATLGIQTHGHTDTGFYIYTSCAACLTARGRR